MYKGANYSICKQYIIIRFKEVGIVLFIINKKTIRIFANGF